MRFLLIGGFFLCSIGIDTALQKDIDIVLRQGAGSPEGRAAWERLSQAKADALPALLAGMGKETVAANWLRTACDRIADREGKALDKTKILAFVKDVAKNGRARRYALELLERGEPGTSAEIYRAALDDPEFRYEAVALVLDQARKTSSSLRATELFQLAFDKSRDVAQARAATAGLQPFNVQVSVADHLGFFTDWYLIGPFDGKKQQGFRLSYPPEKKVDLREELDGKLHWKRYHVKEAKTGHVALVNLREKAALGDADDAVAFAYTEFAVERAMDAEMRGAADDNLTVWVNGVKVFAFEEWRNGVRHDRHRFPVRLNAGKNSVLVKVCQSQAPNPEPNWEFFLRVVDATGKGIAKRDVLK